MLLKNGRRFYKIFHKLNIFCEAVILQFNQINMLYCIKKNCIKLIAFLLIFFNFTQILYTNYSPTVSWINPDTTLSIDVFNWSNSDWITNTGNLQMTWTWFSWYTIEIFSWSTSWWNWTVNGNWDWSIDLTSLNEQKYNLNVVQSSWSEIWTWTYNLEIDTTSPSKPWSLPDLYSSDDTWTSSTDNITSMSGWLTFSWTCEVWSGVHVNLTWTWVDENYYTWCSIGWSFSYTYSGSSLSGWIYNIKYNLFDVAWNTWSYSTGVEITIDVDSPEIQFSNDVESWPVIGETVKIEINELNIYSDSYMYRFVSNTWSCGSWVESGTWYVYESWTWFVLTWTWNNDKYLCAKAVDLAWNKSYKYSSNDINIDLSDPTASVEYTPSFTTSWSVIATLTWYSEIITITNNSWSNTYTFNSNGSFTFEYTDQAWNTWTTIAEVDYIDSISPIVNIESESLTIDSDTYFINWKIIWWTWSVNISWGSWTVSATIWDSWTFKAKILLKQNTINTLIVTAIDEAWNTWTWSIVVTESDSADEFSWVTDISVNDIWLVADSSSWSFSSTTKVTINQSVSFSSWDMSISLPSWVEIINSSWWVFNATKLAVAFVPKVVWLWINESSVWAVSFGVWDVWLHFSKPVKIEIPVTWVTSSTIKVKVKHIWTSDFVTTGLTANPGSTCTNGIPQNPSVTATVLSWIAVIYTCSASEFAAYEVFHTSGHGRWALASENIAEDNKYKDEHNWTNNQENKNNENEDIKVWKLINADSNHEEITIIINKITENLNNILKKKGKLTDKNLLRIKDNILENLKKYLLASKYNKKSIEKEIILLYKNFLKELNKVEKYFSNNPRLNKATKKIDHLLNKYWKDDDNTMIEMRNSLIKTIDKYFGEYEDEKLKNKLRFEIITKCKDFLKKLLLRKVWKSV